MRGVTRQVGAAFVAASMLGAVGGASAAYEGVPHVLIAQRAPLIVVGRGFIGRERLRLVVRGSSSVSRELRANAAGSFTARFPSIQVSRCDALSIVVRRSGATSVRGFAKPLPECAQRATG